MFYPFLLSFIGYAMGRIGHIYGSYIAFIPHHWIPGLILMLVALFWKKYPARIRKIIFFFGLGLFISDFKDFTDLKTWEPEDVETVKFWGID